MPAETPSKIRRKVLGDQLEQHLRGALAAGPGAPAVTVVRGEVTTALPVIRTAGQDDPSGRLAPYVVLFDGVGSPGLEPDLADTNDDLAWSCQMIVGAGWPVDCSNTVDRIYSACYRWQPVIPGLAFGRLQPPPGYDPGPLRPNTQVSPPRWWTPLQWRLDVTA